MIKLVTFLPHCDLQVFSFSHLNDCVPGGSMVKNPHQEDPLKKGMATHSSILAWEIPWTEEPGGLQSMWS